MLWKVPYKVLTYGSIFSHLHDTVHEDYLLFKLFHMLQGKNVHLYFILAIFIRLYIQKWNDQIKGNERL